MSPLPDLRAGVYRHYKGHLYQVLGYAHDANADSLGRIDGETGASFDTLGERFVVVYVGLQTRPDNTGPRLAVCDAEDFLFEHMHHDPAEDSVDLLTRQTGLWRECTEDCSLRYSRHVPRFEYLGPGL